MTQESYFDMCEQLGSTPLEDEIPVEVSDFPTEVIQAWQVYSRLPSNIDSFSGTYLGKDLHLVSSVLDLFNIHEDRLFMYDLISLIDNIEKVEINNLQSNKRNIKRTK
jgi:hypothetical protein